MEHTLPEPPPPLPRPGEPWPLGTHYVTIPSLEEARRLFGTPDAAARRRKSARFYQGIEARQRLPQGIHDRSEEFTYAAGRLTAQDRPGVARHLPLHYKVIRLHSHRVAAGEVWDLSVRHEAHWPELDSLEELYVFLQVNHLVLEEGARIIICGNVLSIECGMLERASGNPCLEPVAADLYDIGIFPTPFSVDRSTNPNTGARGEDGVAGAAGAPGASPKIEGSLFGPRLVNSEGGAAPAAAPHGEDGGHGGHGGRGCRGRNGGMCRLADIRIGQLVGFTDNPLRLFSRAGAGYRGGDGGRGGCGGNGGNGGDGAEAVNGSIPAGNGGKGGNGGNGGNGGDGGNGGISSNIFLQLRPEDCPRAQTLSLPSAGGAGGRGGPGGLAGAGGKGGRTGQSGPHGWDGLQGRVGIDGAPGKPGKARPGARIFIVPGSVD